MKPERQNTDAEFWTFEQAANHFGITRATIERYIREGLPTYFRRTFVKPHEVIAWRMRKEDNLKRTHPTRSP